MDKQPTHLDLFRSIDIDWDNLPPTPASYWESEDSLVAQRNKENDDIEKDLLMSHERFNEEYTV